MKVPSKTLITIFSFFLFIGGTYAQTSKNYEPKTEKGKRHFELAKKTELESIVLLKNKDNFLPLSKTKQSKVAVFGNGSFAPTNGSGGSGTVPGPFTNNLFEGLASIGVEYDQSVYDYYNANIKITYGWGVSVKINHNWDVSDSEKWGESRYSNTGWNRNSPIADPELNVDDSMVRSASDYSSDKTAIVYITRGVGTEEMDRFDQPSDWYLNPSEYALLKKITRDFDNVIVVLNISGSIDLSWLDFEWLANDPDYNEGGSITEADAQKFANKIKGLVLTYGSGSYHGLIVAELLYGDADFTGKLADSMTKTYNVQPTKDNFHYKTYADKGLNYKHFNSLNGKDDPIYLYQEDIFTGYRYFDTFAADDVLYPFGYGLSYNEYEFKDMNVDASKSEKVISVSATIKNISKDKSLPAGKEVMEVYVSAPEGKLEQPYQKLLDFDKTKKLDQGENETITLNIPVSDLASYDEDKAAYIIEKGDYIIRVGNSSRNTHIAGVVSVDEEILVEQLSNKLTLNGADPTGKADNKSVYRSLRFSTKAKNPSDPATAGYINPNDRKELKKAKTLSINSDYVDFIDNSSNNTLYITGNAPIDYVANLTAVKYGEISLEDFTAQLTKDELVNLLSGGCGTRGSEQFYSDDRALQINNLSSKDEKRGWVGGAGSSRNIRRLGIPSLTYADGSAGISIAANTANLIGIDRNPGFARAAGIACTWNPELQYQWGNAIGEEMRDINVDIWLAPSINLHRNPLNGRNTEYYSEDPILSGKIALLVAKGVAENGLTVCLKHYAGNDQEWYRRGLHTTASVAQGTNKDAANTITSERAIREITLKPFEIAVKGGDVMCVMSAFNKINGKYCAASGELLTDILRGEWGYQGYVVTDWGDFDEIPHAADEMKAGNDMIMSGFHNRFKIPDQIYNGVVEEYNGEPGTVTLAQLQRNAANVIKTILSSKNAFDSKNQYNLELHISNKLAILTTQLPVAIVGLDYSTIKVNPIIIAGNEGTKKYTISIDDSGDQLPTSLKLNGNGFITGVPTSKEVGIYNLVVKVEDDKANSTTKPVTLVVDNITITSLDLPVARLEMDYETQFEGFKALGGTKPSFEIVTGSLPAGLSLTSDGTINGIPDAIGKFGFAVKVTDSEGHYAVKNYKIKVEDVINVSFTPGTPIINARVNSNININISANRKGFNDAYEYELIGAPAWLKLNSRWYGTSISGIPTEVGVYKFKIQAKIMGSMILIDVPYQITVIEESDEKLDISTSQLPGGEVNKPYSTNITSIGGVGMKSFELAADSDQPDGLTLSSQNGTITWTPAGLDFGYYHLKVKVKDQENTEVIKTLSLYIKGSLTVYPSDNSELKATAGEVFNLKMTVSGGTVESYNYLLSSKSDELPLGMSVKDGVISGTPSKKDVGEYDIIIRISENGGSFSGSEVKYHLIISE